MDERGILTGFLVSKLAVAMAAALLFGSILAMYNTFGRTGRRGELKSVVETVAKSLRKVDSLPGRVRLERKLPSVESFYVLVLSGENFDEQVIRISIYAGENYHRTIILGRKVNGGTFFIRRRNPRRIKIKKLDQISVELI